MQRRTLCLGLSVTALLSACGRGDSVRPKFQTYNGPTVTQIQVFKGDRKMYLLSGSTVLKTYDIGLGGNPIGHKQFEGDSKTPEGLYYISWLNPKSWYHLSLGISYPNDKDRAYAESQGKKPGGDIFIHGEAKAKEDLAKGRDWTAGCIAVRDIEVEEIFSMVRVGTPIFIFP